ncbi:hypothetical protein [Chryseobacterium sp. T20]|uniref:hypothetical protein n=1 Tax=Chryseobacterium sp. T20 TaxID=3395375 RepID=UPI0039BC4C19
MKKDVYFNGLDLSIITQYDLQKKYPDFAPLLISPLEAYEEEKLRVLELVTFAGHYKIKELQNKLRDIYKDIYSDLF